MRVSRAFFPVAVAAAVLASTAPASAGGSWLEPDRRAYVPSETATLRGSFDLRGSLTGTLADGPYVAYLLPQGRWIRPGRVPVNAIRLGELTVVPTGSSYPTRARIEFEVPELPLGRYHVGYCNEPCTVTGIGDLIGSQGFVVAPTRAEGLAFIRNGRLATKLANARDALGNARRDRDRLDRAYAQRADELDAALARIEELEWRLEGTRRDSPPSIRSTPSEPSVTWWIVGVAALAALSAGVALGRRRPEPSFVVPDTVPDDLESAIR